MKTTILNVITVAAMLVGAFPAPTSAQNPAQWIGYGRYAEANKALPAPAPGEKRVVFTGNSITDCWIQHDPAFFADHNYIDRGICGQVTSQILLRFREDVLSLNPALVVIAGGTNDIAEFGDDFDPEVTLGNFKTMVELARAHGVKVIIGSLLPCEKCTWGQKTADFPAKIEDMNRRLREYAEAEGIPFANYYPLLVHGDSKALNPDWTVDHIHPTLPGYKVMESVVQPLIEQELGIGGAESRSLDDVEREMFRPGVSPVELPGHAMTRTRVRPPKPSACPRVQSLNGEWQLVEGTDFEANRANAIAAQVPGSVHAALLDAGIIPDPTIGMNDSISEKQSYKDWWYRRVFDYDGKSGKNVMLSFDGVANKCTVYLNGQELGKHEGMLGGPDFMVGDLLRKGSNELLVHLEAIPNIGVGANVSWTQTVVANCVYGWHYVKCPTLGIWNNVSLKEVPDYRIDNPFILTRATDGSMRLVVELPRTVSKGRINMVVRPKNFDGKPQAYTFDAGHDTGRIALDFNIDDPHLWWPNGSGDQSLYTATVWYDDGRGKVHDVKSLNFGIRTIEMRPVGGKQKEDTYNWQFVVNGRPVFIKGANWCLMDFLMDLSAERYGRFLGAARDQHLNLLRAWGGGLVETDLFYDMCDEMGLMVLQEWPTAWNSHNIQAQDVLKETIDRNTRRIRSHPSLAMWAGGNESTEPFGDIIDYMGRTSIEQDGTRPFHRGEPWGGSWHNHDSWWLDLHLNNALNMNALFFGEFGMPSLPVKETVLKYLDGEEYTYPLAEGTVFEHHGPVFGAWEDMRRLFREVSFTVDPSTLDNVILGSQLAQTLGTRRALERARTLWPDRSAGAAYYKINDVFPGLSWGSVDYYGAKKMTYYFVKRSAAPCMPVIIFDETNLSGREAALKYYLLDDNMTLAGQPLAMTVSVYDHMMKKIFERDDTVAVKNSVQPIDDIRLDAKQTTSPLLYFKADVRDMSGNLIARNWYLQNFDSKLNAMFDAPKCALEVSQDGDVVTVTNKSDTVPAVAVSVEVAGEAHTLDLTDNMLWVDPGESISVRMNTTTPATVSAWNRQQ